MRSLPAIASVAAMAAIVTSAAAAPQPDTLHVTLPGVEVTALKSRESIRDVPAATFVVSHAQLQRAGVSRISTVLATLPGLFA